MGTSAIQQGLRTRRFGHVVASYPSVGSTNDVAREMVNAGAAEGTTVLAGEQTGGRGRQGRRWASPLGGLWLSVVLRPSLPLDRWPLIGFAAGAGAAIAVESVSGKTILLKWPNDLMLDGRKLGGILVESSGDAAILGIGINANVALTMLPEDVRATAISLLESLGRPVDVTVLARSMLERLEHYYDLLHRDSRAVVEAWRRRSFLNGRRVKVNGEASLEGVVEDIDNTGALLIRTASGVHALTAGDVSIREMRSS